MPKQLKSLKKIKGLSLLPQPYLNYIDQANQEFMQYAPHISSLTAPANSNVVSANHTQIAGLCDQFNESPGFKDIALLGRSNVGKSSLINQISGRQFAITSKTPGKTRDLQFIDLGLERRIVDCPGYGFARAAGAEKEQWRKLMEIYLTQSTTIHRAMLLVDLHAGMQDSDA
jgi:GTP-binding protein EngB required for normal cell division